MIVNFSKCSICIYSKPHILITVLDFQGYIWCSSSPSRGEHILLFCIYISASCVEANDLQLCSILKDVWTLITVIQLLLVTSTLDALTETHNSEYVKVPKCMQDLRSCRSNKSGGPTRVLSDLLKYVTFQKFNKNACS